MIRILARQTPGFVEVVFSNTGTRIPAEKLDTIFEKFYRLDAARYSETGGAGLGLAIAKEIVELHGGSICAQSDETETRFLVRLPDKEERET